MALNPVAIGIIGGFYFYKGAPSIKSELKGANYSVEKKGSYLDTLINTPLLGDFEIRVIENSKKQYELDEINYSNSVFSKMNVYKNTMTIMPSTSSSPFEYKISTKNNNVDLSLKHKAIGKAMIKISPDNSGIYHLKRISFYDKSGKMISTYSPPIKKSRKAGFAGSTVSKSSSSGKPSP
jgi:hypothetical protein